MTKDKEGSWPPSELGEKVAEFSGSVYEGLPALGDDTLCDLQRALDKMREYIPDDELDKLVRPMARAYRELSNQCSIDPLTGLPNRAAFLRNFKREFLSARRSPRHPIAYITADVDNFKAINDTYGHLVGDVCLRLLGHVFQEHEYFPSKTRSATGLVRGTDYVGRMGGEEFSILLSKVSSAKTAYDVAERIRRTLEGRTRNKKWLRKALNQLNVHMPGLKMINGASGKFYPGEHFEKFSESERGSTEIEGLHFRDLPSYTLSIGVCFHNPTENGSNITIDDLVEKADNALYASKRNGRNQTTLWEKGMKQLWEGSSPTNVSAKVSNHLREQLDKK